MGESDDTAREDAGLTAAGGWTAPAPAFYDSELLKTNLYSVSSAFPTVSVQRGGVRFEPPSPYRQRAQSALQALTLRVAEQTSAFRKAAVDAACLTALAEGWDVHVYEPPTPYDLRRADGRDLLYMRHVGIEFTPADHPVPVIHYHQTSPDWEWEYDDA